VQQCTSQWGDKICTFWEVSEKGGITIVRHKLLEFLSTNGGYYLYYYDKKSTIYKIVKVQDGFVEEATTEHLKKFIDAYIMGLPNSFDGITPNQLLEAIYKGANTYFSSSLLEFMQRIELNLLKDTPHEAFFSFKNGVLKVTADKKELLTYGALNCHVWKNRVIDFRIDPDEAIDWHAVEFVRFLKKICSNDLERLLYVVQIIGYILHGYKDATRPFAVILAEETEKDKEGGGTGKGIFFKAVAKMLDVVFVDGKNFKLDKSFAFQRVELSTQLIVIEDCRKNVDFEGFYSHLTEGITVEKKNKDELYIPYQDAAKFGFTTNYTINLKGNHGKRRGKVIEFSNFFNPQNTPLDFFGHQMFEGWDGDEWNRFYNMMAECVQAYLKEGISTQYNSESMKRKAVKLNFGEEFFEYFEEIKLEEWKFISDEYNYFLGQSGLEKKDFSLKRFKAGLESSCESIGYTFEERKNRAAENRKEFKIN
jgi:phage/plasmid-associated DNA primase